MGQLPNRRRLISSLVVLPALKLLFGSCFVEGWSAEWIDLSSIGASPVTPGRSGHVAFALNDKIYLFGGYVEKSVSESPSDGDTGDRQSTTVMPSRYPSNDLWQWDNLKCQWTCIQEEDLWDNQGEENPEAKSLPQQRLAAASAAIPEDAGYIFGGWDSQDVGTGGVVLDDVASFDGSVWQSSRTKSGELPNLGSPTSRLCAVTLEDNKTILLHNHRCEKSVFLFHTGTGKLVEQPTTGKAPSPRGLHAIAALGSRVICFGGASQSGSMSNEVFVLDTKTWTWAKPKVKTIVSPTERASPCLVAVDNTTCVMFGGADQSRVDEGVGLHGCNDLWSLTVEVGDDDEVKAVAWNPLKTDILPPGRNAATLTRLSSAPAGLHLNKNHKDAHYFLLTGGWYPFQTTHSDTFLLKINK